MKILIFGVCILLRVWDPGNGGLLRLHNVIIVGWFYYLLLLKLLHVSVYDNLQAEIYY
jgi:hypothetical protein